ncbi:hypothetical protein SDC9_136248 [bioreactor metagenome]|uniref:Uncharacterized protein n=1 Tax=bioreactor metagenome TaxID=1076179 RepID=A0A645DI29_9ZZZZ
MQPRTGLHGRAGQQVVEDRTRTDQAEIRKCRQLGPGHRERLGSSAVDAQPLVANPSRRRAGVDAQPAQHPHGARGQPVAAHLLTGELGFLQEQNIETLTGQERRRR